MSRSNHSSTNRPGAQPPKTLQPKMAGRSQPLRAAQVKPHPVAPPVYRPQPVPKVLQTKAAANYRPQKPQAERPPVAPPVYRPQPAPRVLQAKKSTAQQPLNQSKRAPIAPPVYRAQPIPKVLQTKKASSRQPGQSLRQLIVPPVYRPEAKKVVQPKAGTITPPSKPLAAASVMRQPTASKLSCSNIQRKGVHGIEGRNLASLNRTGNSVVQREIVVTESFKKLPQPYQDARKILTEAAASTQSLLYRMAEKDIINIIFDAADTKTLAELEKGKMSAVEAATVVTYGDKISNLIVEPVNKEKFFDFWRQQVGVRIIVNQDMANKSRSFGQVMQILAHEYGVHAEKFTELMKKFGLLKSGETEEYTKTGFSQQVSEILPGKEPGSLTPFGQHMDYIFGESKEYKTVKKAIMSHEGFQHEKAKIDFEEREEMERDVLRDTLVSMRKKPQV